jgi:predicted DNA-binding protein (MmcQ/YjbR family)
MDEKYQLPDYINEVIEKIEKSIYFRGAKIYWRPDWEIYYFDLAGHFFGLAWDRELSFKLKPEENWELRDRYPEFIVPAFHLNKNHWSGLEQS